MNTIINPSIWPQIIFLSLTIIGLYIESTKNHTLLNFIRMFVVNVLILGVLYWGNFFNSLISWCQR